MSEKKQSKKDEAYESWLDKYIQNLDEDELIILELCHRNKELKPYSNNSNYEPPLLGA